MVLLYQRQQDLQASKGQTELLSKMKTAKLLQKAVLGAFDYILNNMISHAEIWKKVVLVASQQQFDKKIQDVSSSALAPCLARELVHIFY